MQVMITNDRSKLQKQTEITDSRMSKEDMNTKDDENERDELVTRLYLWNRQIQVMDDD